MKLLTKVALATTVTIAAFSINAKQAMSEKHAKGATETRQAVFKLLGANMGPLGGMARGKIPFDAKKIAVHAERINQLSLMINDHTKVDTSKFSVDTEALDGVWTNRAAFEKRTLDLTKASAHLQTVAATGDEAAIKKAISGVGRTCGG